MSQYERNPAIRTVAACFNQATYSFQEDDSDRAPQFTVLPTGVAVNRVLHVGTVTEIDDVGSDSEYLRAKIVDPTGNVFAYAGQYQPEAMAAMREVEPPAFVAVIGKVSTYETDDGNVNVSVRPEEFRTVSKATRDRWTAEATARTLQRIEVLRKGESPNPEVVEFYGTDPDELRQEIDGAVQEFRDRMELPDGEQETAPTPA